MDTMEADSPPRPESPSRLGDDVDTTIHGFNVSNITVIEKTPACEGSDSGVEVLEGHDALFQRTFSQRSCDSSIISCCSNYEDAYNLLVRRNSTLLGCDGSGSESSSLTGSSSSRNSKKKVNVQEAKKNGVAAKERSRSKPPQTPRRETAKLRSVDRLQGKSTKKPPPSALDLTKKDKRPASARASKTPAVTPTDDGRWPSINSRPAPLMARSRGLAETPKLKTAETKTIEKYATLPRRRKEKSNDEVKEQKKSPFAKKTIPRDLTPSKSLSTVKKKQKIKIYHETSVQTALTVDDVDKALAGAAVTPMNPSDAEKCDKSEQVDIGSKEMERLEAKVKELMEKYEGLQKEHKQQGERFVVTEARLREEQVEKEGLREELKNNSQRVLAILGEANPNDDENTSSDSLLVLESRFQTVSQVLIRQEDEISKLHSCCRSLQLDLEKSIAAQKILVQQQQDLEAESVELQEFMQAEKTTLSDALKEAEGEMVKSQKYLVRTQQELSEKQEEVRRLKQENLGLKARMGALEAKSRELLVQQGSSVSGTAVALSALVGRLEGLVEELVGSYDISEQELEDLIFHNEAYSNSSSSPDATPEKIKKLLSDRTPSPKKGSSFVSAVINAIKNAAAQSPFAGHKDLSRENLYTATSSPNELLDSETEPCLMMEHVLEDVTVPDGHTHNMISSCHSILSSQSDSYIDLSRSNYSEMPSLCEIFPSLSLVDQVIDVDNLVTRLLKVIRIIQLENDDCMNELQDQRDRLSDQVHKQKETNKLVSKQLKDWEILGARLKAEVKELMQQLSKKNNEIDGIKAELSKQRDEVEKLNRDVCELSTALAKAEQEIKIKDEEVTEAMKNWEVNEEVPASELMKRLNAEIPRLKEKLSQKERHLSELTQEFLASRQVLTESLKEAVSEAKKQYDAIDNALEVLHNNQNVVQQCRPLAELQRELENMNFQTASAMPIAPPDCNANAALLQAIANLQINTTA